MEGKREIRLSARVYDRLKKVADYFGGVGYRLWWRRDYPNVRDDVTCPVCINGMAVYAGVADDLPITDACGQGPTPSMASGIYVGDNDTAVSRLIVRGQFKADKYGIKRVSWDDYVKELNIVRVA